MAMLTNFKEENLPIYEEAIEAYKDKYNLDILHIEDSAYDIYGRDVKGCKSLHLDGNRDMSSFWEIFRDIKERESECQTLEMKIRFDVENDNVTVDDTTYQYINSVKNVPMLISQNMSYSNIMRIISEGMVNPIMIGKVVAIDEESITFRAKSKEILEALKDEMKKCKLTPHLCCVAGGCDDNSLHIGTVLCFNMIKTQNINEGNICVLIKKNTPR